jgi:hypothetical protein
LKQKGAAVLSNVIDRTQNGANPFAVLDVTTRDTRERIVQAAEDRAFFADSDACIEARAILTNPRQRLEAELGWFPGVAPSTARRATEARDFTEIEALAVSGLPKANALVACGLRHPPVTLSQLVFFLTTVAVAIDGIVLEAVLRDVNEDREISGFPSISSIATAEEMLRDRHQAWRRGVISVLSRIPTSLMAEGLYCTSDNMAAAGHFPHFMNEIIEDYALRAQPFLQEEIAGATKLVMKAKSIAADRPRALPPLIDGLAELLETWVRFTRPIQLSHSALGKTDQDGERLGFMIRSLAIDLHNDHNLTEEARRLTDLLAARFASLPNLMSKITEDSNVLKALSAQAQERDAEIAYAAEIGAFKKSRLAINSTTLEWKGHQYAAAAIHNARWGATRKSLNGVHTGTDYLIAWSDGQRSAVVDLRDGQIYDAFIDRLWRVLAKPILTSITEGLRSGKEYPFSYAVVRDDSITLPSFKIFGEKRTQFAWNEVTTRVADGSFIIDGPANSRASVKLSFRDVQNVHFLQALVCEAAKKGHRQLSKVYD